MRTGLARLLGAGLAVVAVATAGLLGPPPAAAAAAAAATATTTSASTTTTTGLSATEHAALVHAGAYGKHPVTFLLLGDSIALTLGFGLARNAGVEYGMTILNHSTLGCDLDPQLEILTSGAPGPATQGCGKWRALWPYLVATVQPQVVALGVGRWEVSDHFYQGHWVHIGQKVWDDHLTADLQHAIGIFHEFGAKVVLFTMPYVDPSDRQPDGAPWVENTPQRAQLFNQLVKQVARADPSVVSVIDLNKMLGPDNHYTSTVDGVVTRWSDGIHISEAGGQFLQNQILPVIDRLALEDEAEGHHK